MPRIDDHPRLAPCPTCGHYVLWRVSVSKTVCRRCKADLEPEINGLDLHWFWRIATTPDAEPGHGSQRELF